MEGRRTEEHREVTAVWCPVGHCYAGTTVREMPFGLTEICARCGRLIRVLRELRK